MILCCEIRPLHTRFMCVHQHRASFVLYPDNYSCAQQSNYKRAFSHIFLSAFISQNARIHERKWSSPFSRFFWQFGSRRRGCIVAADCGIPIKYTARITRLKVAISHKKEASDGIFTKSVLLPESSNARPSRTLTISSCEATGHVKGFESAEELEYRKFLSVQLVILVVSSGNDSF